MRQYAETGLVAIDLANTWDEYLDDPERLPDPAALHRFCAELGEPGGDLDDSPGAEGGPAEDRASARGPGSRLSGLGSGFSSGLDSGLGSGACGGAGGAGAVAGGAGVLGG